jgi:DNA-binding transcriptional LysR family regulator
MDQGWLNGIEDFLAVAGHDGLNAASRATGTPKATLSRRIRDLEATLGTRLLERGDRRLRLTEEGRYLLERAAPLLAELQEVGEAVSGRGTRPSGPLKVNVPSLFAQTRWMGFAADFMARYPEVTLHVDIADHYVDPVRDGYDLVVRVNPRPDTELVGKCFLRTESVIAAGPGMPPPARPGAEVPAVVLTALAGLSEWTAVSDTGELRMTPRPVMVCSSMMLVYGAVLRGAGCAMLPLWLIEDDLRAGRLTLWGTVPNGRREAWVLHTSRRLTSPKVRVFVDALVDAFRVG